MPKRVFESRSLNCSLFGRVAYGGEYYGRAAGLLAPGAEVSGSEPAELAPQSSIRIRILHTIFVQRDREFKDRTQGLGVVTHCSMKIDIVRYIEAISQDRYARDIEANSKHENMSTGTRYTLPWQRKCPFGRGQGPAYKICQDFGGSLCEQFTHSSNV